MDKIEVSQRAREAAADLLRAIYHKHGKGVVFQVSQPESPSMLNGERDNGVLAQAFARFERDILATRTDATPVAWMDLLANAYSQGAEDVHNAWIDGTASSEPDFGEAASDYARSIDFPPATDVAALVEALVAHNDALRSASQVAYRDGKDTNWLTFRGAITYTLAEHHDTVNAARQALAPFTKGQP